MFSEISVAHQSRVALGVWGFLASSLPSFSVVYSERKSSIPIFVSRVYGNNRDYGVEKGMGITDTFGIRVGV